MTGLDAHSKLFEYFNKKDSLIYDDIEKLGPKNILQTERIVCYLSALEDLVKSDVLFVDNVHSKTGEIVKTWVLKKPLNFYQQTIVINGNTASNIAAVVNHFANIINAKDLVCSPLNIQEKDILTVLEVINVYAQKTREEDEIQKDSKEQNI